LSALGQAAPPAGARVLKVPRGIVVVQDERPRGLPANAPFDRHWLLEDDTSLSGNDITDPKQTFDPQDNQPVVSFGFTDEGERAFEEVTRRIAQRGSEQILPPGASPQDASQRFAITLDNQLVSLASVNFREYPEGIEGSNGAQIDGIGNIEETQALADNLRIGALPIELKLVSQTRVSATLGAQALRQGFIAGAAGLALTLLFLVALYRVLGVIASITLMIYAVLLYAIVELIPITLTLPGIAGMILTLGVAADANIVVFERIKEEARTGRSIPAAIAAGYGKALRTIIDANVVTFGVAFILFLVATAGQGLRVHARDRDPGLALHGGARDLGDPRSGGSHALAALAPRARRRHRAAAVELRLHGRVEVVLLVLGGDPRRGRDRDRGARAQLRDRLRVGHAPQDPARAARDGRPGERHARAARPRRRQDPAGRRARARGERGPDLGVGPA